MVDAEAGDEDREGADAKAGAGADAAIGDEGVGAAGAIGVVAMADVASARRARAGSIGSSEFARSGTSSVAPGTEAEAEIIFISSSLKEAQRGAEMCRVKANAASSCCRDLLILFVIRPARLACLAATDRPLKSRPRATHNARKQAPCVEARRAEASIRTAGRGQGGRRGPDRARRRLRRNG